MFSRRLVISTFTAIVFSLASFATSAGADDTKLTIFAAASLKTALDKVSAAWTADTKKDTVISFAASSALAKQIEAGAPADVFISADTSWMSYLSDKKLVAADGVINLLGNEIVLIAPKDSKIEAKLEKGVDLAALLGDGKLAMADVKAVPAGKYGKAALESLGAWAAVEAKVAQAENVRAALKLVATGEAALGIVYVTDAHAEPAVKVVATFPAESHPAIIYPAAVVAGSKNADAAGFVTFLQSPKALDIFKAEGFTVVKP
jgi:molybdate transport system substrate-binding protein